MSTRKSYVRTLEAAGLLDSASNNHNGAFISKWIHRFGECDIGLLHFYEDLRLEATYLMSVCTKEKARSETSDHLQRTNKVQ